ncbi:MAG: 2Fe-2S iron-sulfur cluster-binding protein [Bdellovibrionales bacterium]
MSASVVEITFIETNGAHKTVTASENQSLMQAAKDHNINGIEGVCEGCMACTTCHVHIPPAWQSRVNTGDNEQSEEERDILEMAANNTPNSRLGCQIRITKDLCGLVVSVA